MVLDELDRELLVLVLEQPQAGLREYARILGAARGTVATRFQRLRDAGVIADLAPEVDPGAFGYSMLAFVHLDLAQGHLDSVVERLQSVAHVLEAHTVLGNGDLLCQVVARDTVELERVIQQIVAMPGVVRTRSQMALTRRIPRRTLPLVRSTEWAPARNR
ncbi:MAG TPA: Lrp/AsnC family transcriptional regulator [Pseudonocardia sp.]|jgi:DNA-binding Lrp family transcriptional regulator|nr:Lrp/AsnC family transcriptional regulator [Pseudonocardia sp.]